MTQYILNFLELKFLKYKYLLYLVILTLYTRLKLLIIAFKKRKK